MTAPEDPWGSDYERDLEHMRSAGRWNALVGFLLVAAVVGVVVVIALAVRMLLSGDYCLIECGV